MSKIVVRILIGVLALVLLLVGFATLVATTPWGQGFVTRQVNSYLAQKLQSPFRIGRITYRIPDWIELEDVFFKTPKGDTLLAGGRLRVDLDMWGLLHSRVALNQIELERTRLNVTRTLPDTTFNFQYLLNAFTTPGPATPVDSTAKPLDINLTAVLLKDVRIRYKDDVVGADVNASVDSLRAKFNKTDIHKSQYYLSDVAVDGLDVATRLYAGLPTPPSAPSKPGDTLDIGLGKWIVNRAKWDIDAQTADFQTRGRVGRLAMESDYVYLNGEKIGLKSLELINSDVAAVLTKPTKKATTTAPGVDSPGWQAKLTNVRFANNRLRFDNETAKRQRTGLDYSHLDLRGLGINGRFLTYADLGKRGQRISGQLRNGRFRATSGFVLQSLNGDVLYSDTTTTLTRLFIQTGPASRPTSVLRDRLVLRYDSLGQLTNPRFANRVAVRVNLKQSRLSVDDVLQLAPFLANTPPFAGNHGGEFRANAEAYGTLAALNLPRFELDMLSGTRIRAQGRLTNVTDPNRIGLDLNITDGTTTLADINKLAPKGSIPASIALPPTLKLTGRLQGALNDLTLNSTLKTDWGTAAFTGTLAGFVPGSRPTGKNQTYTGTLNLNQFDAGKWLKQTGTVGKLTGKATFDGRGIDVNTLTTRFALDVQSADLNGYTYQNLNASGNLAAGKLKLTGTLNDPNANLILNTQVGLKTGPTGTYPSITGETVINELNLQKLKLYKDPLSLRGRIVLNMASTDPVRPIGTVSVGDAVVTLNGRSYPVDSLYARLGADGPNKHVVAQLPGARINLDGQFAYDRLYDIVAGEVSKYIAIPDLTYHRIPPPYAFSLNLKAYQNPLLRAFVPALIQLDTVRLNAYLDNRNAGPTRDTTLSATLRTGVINYDTTIINGVALNLRAVGNQLAVNGRINQMQVSGYQVGQTNLRGMAANNQFRFAVTSKDSINQDRYGLAGKLSIVDQHYRLQLDRKGFLANYATWMADTSGYAQYGKDGVFINTLRLEQGSQALEVASTEQYGNAPIRITTRAIELTNLERLAGQDTTLASGQLNGTVVVRDYLSADSKLAFIGSVYVDSLRVTGQPIGNLTGRFSNATDGRINVNTVLSGPFNDATVTGFYNPNSAPDALALTVNLKRLDARTIQAFSFGELRQAKGNLNGQFTVAGAVNNPKLDGSVAFDSVAFNVKQLNATYRIDKETIVLAGQTITLNGFSLRDAQGRTLTTDGTVTLRDLPNAPYNLRVRADHFQVLNAARKDNDYAYGQAAITADLRIKGAGTSPSVRGQIRLEDGSKVSIVLPDESQDVNADSKIVTFINHNDTLALSKYLLRPKRDSLPPRLAFDQLSNANISLDLEADEKSELTIVVDELNGDYLRARGNARLNASLNAAGEVTVLGRYDVTEGEYSLTYQVLKRQFKLQKGGYIQFTGDPLKADINLTAIYNVSVPPGDLIGSESTTTSDLATNRKLPFQVALTISNNLSAPKLDFDIRLPGAEDGAVGATSELATTIENKLKSLRQDPSQINKQVFALLILNRFLPENTSDFFSSGSGSGGGLGGQAQNVALGSVSKLLSDQFGRLASGILKGIADVDFNLLSQSGSANTGGTSNGVRTDLNVGLSRSFLAGRVTVSVGKNFIIDNSNSTVPSQNQVLDNVSVNYNVTRDGRYVLRAYRRNDYQAVLDGYVIETGVGFVITMDYNTLADILRRSPGKPAPDASL